MKKILCLCLMIFLLVACSSEKEAKPKAAAAPATPTAEAPEASAPVVSLSGDYVFTETNANKIMVSDQEYTCQTTHTYTLMFINDQTVQYTAKTDQSIDPPAEGMMCQSKLYNVDETGTYEIKNGLVVTLTFSSEEKTIPWVHNNMMSLRLKDANTLTIANNGSEFRKQ